MMMIWNWILQAVGTLGGVLFATACVPLARQAIKKGTSGDTPASAIYTFTAANVLFGTYLFLSLGYQLPVLLSAVEVVSWSIVLWYYWFPRRYTDFIDSIFARSCTRKEGHDGPCNGLPKRGCTVFISDHGPLHNQKVRVL